MHFYIVIFNIPLLATKNIYLYLLGISEVIKGNNNFNEIFLFISLPIINCERTLPIFITIISTVQNLLSNFIHTFLP